MPRCRPARQIVARHGREIDAGSRRCTGSQRRSRRGAVAAPSAGALRSRRGGRVIESDPLTNTLVAVVPSARLPASPQRADVRAIERAPLRRAGCDGTRASRLRRSARRRGGPAGFTGGRGVERQQPGRSRDRSGQDPAGPSGVRGGRLSRRRRAGARSGSPITERRWPAWRSVAGRRGCGECVPDDADRKGVAPGLDTVLDAALLEWQRLRLGARHDADAEHGWRPTLPARPTRPKSSATVAGTDHADDDDRASRSTIVIVAVARRDDRATRPETPVPRGPSRADASPTTASASVPTTTGAQRTRRTTAWPTSRRVARPSAVGRSLTSLAVGVTHVRRRRWAEPCEGSLGRRSNGHVVRLAASRRRRRTPRRQRHHRPRLQKAILHQQRPPRPRHAERPDGHTDRVAAGLGLGRAEPRSSVVRTRQLRDRFGARRECALLPRRGRGGRRSRDARRGIAAEPPRVSPASAFRPE